MFSYFQPFPAIARQVQPFPFISIYFSHFQPYPAISRHSQPFPAMFCHVLPCRAVSCNIVFSSKFQSFSDISSSFKKQLPALSSPVQPFPALCSHFIYFQPCPNISAMSRHFSHFQPFPVLSSHSSYFQPCSAISRHSSNLIYFQPFLTISRHFQQFFFNIQPFPAFFSHVQPFTAIYNSFLIFFFPPNYQLLSAISSFFMCCTLILYIPSRFHIHLSLISSLLKLKVIQCYQTEQ